MKKILIIFALLFSVIATAQQYHDKGAKFENATSVGDTISNNTRIPIIDEFGLVNYYVDVADLLALNPAPVLEWGNITGTLSNQTDLQGALNSKADQSDLTAHTSNGNIHFTQSAISITESQINDLKDYLRGDINDTNGANKLTLGSLEVTGQTILQNGLNMSSVPVGTSDNILTLNGTTGDVEQRVFSLGDIDIANAAGTNQFPIGLGDQLRFEGSGDTSISFDGVTNTINITSVPGSGTGGAVTSFNGRTGGVVSETGDYSTAMVNENTNLYFTEPRVRATPLTGLTVTNTPISSTNTFIQALGRLQGQINNREVSFAKNTAFNKNFGTTSGTVLQGNWRPSWGDITGVNPSYNKSESDGKYLLNTTDQLTGNLTLIGDFLIQNGGLESSLTANVLKFNRSNGASYIDQDGDDGTISIRFKSNSKFSLDANAANFSVDLTANNLSGTNSGDETASGLLTKIKSVDGAGSGLDADLLDGLNSSSFMRSDKNTYTSGTVTAQSFQATNGNLSTTLGPNSFSFSRDSGPSYIDQTGTGTISFRLNGVEKMGLSSLGINGNGSGLTNVNADLLDGINSTGYAKMNTTNTGSITFTGDVIANSDKRLKKNIKRIDNALAIVQLLGGYEYDRKDIDLHQAGVIAQEVEEVFPTAVSEDEKGIKSVAYNQLIALLIEAVKEQQIEIENLKTLINEK